jgi:hypothetical protein
VQPDRPVDPGPLATPSADANTSASASAVASRVHRRRDNYGDSVLGGRRAGTSRPASPRPASATRQPTPAEVDVRLRQRERLPDPQACLCEQLGRATRARYDMSDYPDQQRRPLPPPRGLGKRRSRRAVAGALRPHLTQVQARSASAAPCVPAEVWGRGAGRALRPIARRSPKPLPRGLAHPESEVPGSPRTVRGYPATASSSRTATRADDLDSLDCSLIAAFRSHFRSHPAPDDPRPPHRSACVQGFPQWARLDSNQGPTDYESAALTS